MIDTTIARSIRDADLEGLSDDLTVVESGSFYTCTPAVQDTDRDYFILDVAGLRETLGDLGFKTPEVEGEDYPEDYFDSYKKGPVNVIVVERLLELERIKLATDVCKSLNLTVKEDRIAVFNAIEHRLSPWTGSVVDLCTFA